MDAAVWTALADTNRRHILDALRRGPRSVNKLTAELGMSQPNVSKHLRVMRDSNLVRVRQNAQRRIYELDLAAFHDIDEWLDPYRSLWNRQLTALAKHLDQKES